MPEDLGITKFRRVGGEDGIVGIFGECVPVVGGVGNFLGLGGRSAEGVDCNYAVGLVGKEARGIVCVDDSTASENTFGGVRGEDGNWLICPVEEVCRGGMAPVLVAGYNSCRVVLGAVSIVIFGRLVNFVDTLTLIVQMVCTLNITEQAIRIC